MIKVCFFIIEARALKREVEPKGQLISKCPFGVFKSPKGFVRISDLASERGPIKKIV